MNSINLPQRHREHREHRGSILSFKGFLCALCAFAVFTFSATAAEIYRWTDDDGVVHVTDDRSQIPAKYWEEERVKKEEIKPSPNDIQSEKPAVTPKPTEKGDIREVFGDYPLEWWIYKFRDIRKNIADSQERVDREKNFVTVFEGGRGYGKIYTKEEIAQYESYKADLPVTEERLKKLNDELEELHRKARIYGVPKKVTE